MKNKYYAYILLESGRQGIADNWKDCESLVKGVEARYRGFETRDEAEKWLEMGAKYEVKRTKELEPGIYFDAGTGRGNGVEISVTDESGKDLLHEVLSKDKINRHGKHLLSEEYTNNFGELLAMKHALEIASQKKIKKVFGDSKLVIDFWSKWKIKKDMPEETISLSREVSKLRDDFELLGGSVHRISGDHNPADLGFH